MTNADHRAGGAKPRVLLRTVTLEREGDRMVPVAVCPRRLNTLSVEECGRCQHFAGLCVNPDTGAPFMRCSFSDAPFLAPVAELAGSGPIVADVMTGPPEMIELGASLAEVLHVHLRDAEVVAVAGEDGRALGLLSASDVLQRLYGRGRAEQPVEAGGDLLVRDIMLSPTFRVSPDVPAAQVAAVMAYERIQHVLVVGDGGELAGLVSALDFARWLACRRGYIVPIER